jgi:hypothetical protein
VREGAHHLELGHDVRHRARVRAGVEEDYDAFAGVNHLAERRPVTGLDGGARRWWYERHFVDPRSCKGRGPHVLDVEVLRVREEQREDLVRVRVEEGFHGLQIVDHEPAIKQQLCPHIMSVCDVRGREMAHAGRVAEVQLLCDRREMALRLEHAHAELELRGEVNALVRRDCSCSRSVPRGRRVGMTGHARASGSVETANESCDATNVTFP